MATNLLGEDAKPHGSRVDQLPQVLEGPHALGGVQRVELGAGGEGCPQAANGLVIGLEAELEVQQAGHEVNGRSGLEGSIGEEGAAGQLLGHEGRHGEPESPAVDRPVALESPVQLVPDDPHLLDPVRGVPTRPHGDHRPAPVLDHEHVVPPLRGAAGVEGHGQSLGPRHANGVAETHVVGVRV